MAISIDQPVLFIVDAPGLARNAGVIGVLGGRYVSIDKLDAHAVDGQQMLAIDVDLTVSSNVKTLRLALSGRRAGFFHGFAVDLHRRLEIVHANILGATALMKRPFHQGELNSRLAAFRAAMNAPMPTGQAESSIASAADAIGDMFAALTSGQAVELPSLLEASGEVAEAIAAVGFPSWVDTVRQHHKGTFQHCLIVTGLATTFAQATGMSRRDVVTLTTAGLLHDIGKGAIPVSILDKPGRLTEEEFEVIRGHPGLGYDHLRGQQGIDSDILTAVRGHHEYLDGSGYPDGLSGGDIGDLTRILTICDVFGAMIERRSYKEPHSPAAAMAVLDNMSAEGKLEPALVRAFHLAAA